MTSCDGCDNECPRAEVVDAFANAEPAEWCTLLSAEVVTQSPKATVGESKVVATEDDETPSTTEAPPPPFFFHARRNCEARHASEQCLGVSMYGCFW